jgi:hypothetical protein
LEIIDCVINHPSIWAQKTEGVLFGNQFMYEKTNLQLGIIANPVLYEKTNFKRKGNFPFGINLNQECMVL